MEETMSTPLGSFCFDEAVSTGGRSMPEEEEDDDLYYVPERRPSLDLGNDSTAMDTSNWQGVEQATTPVLSYKSMMSDGFHDEMDDPDDSVTRLHLKSPTDSYSSSYTLDSDDCEIRTHKVRSKEDCISEPPERPELIRDPNEIRHPSLTVGFTFKALSATLNKLSEDNLKRFKVTLWKHYPESFSAPPQDMIDLVDRLLECYDLEVSLQLTKALLQEMELTRVVDYLQNLCNINEVSFELKGTLKKKYSVWEGSATQGEKAFDNVFTDLTITTTWDNGPNIQHEIRHIEKMNTIRNEEKLISCQDILNTERLLNDYTSCVLSTGMPGTGKSMAVQKLILDWAEERCHQHISLLFPLPLRELNAFQGSNISLMELVNTLYPETKKLKELNRDVQVLFVCDGLDEFNEKLGFRTTELLYDSARSIPLNVLVVNLIKGNFNGIVWITSRPLRENRIPLEAAHGVLEVRGFNDAQKEEYFKKRFEDPVQADRVIAHLKSCKTLHIMCHLPLFCSVLSDVFQHVFKERGSQAELPRSITYMYTKLLLVLLHSRSLRAPAWSSAEELDFLMKLGKIAFIMLEKGETKISKSHWKDSGLNIEDTVVNSGLCTEFMIEQFILLQEMVQCFIHSTVQEYMAALYVFLSFRNHGKNPLEQPLKGKMRRIFKPHRVFKNAVDRSLHFEDGRLDIFLRFLLGMAVNTNQALLQPFITPSLQWPSVIEGIATLVRKRISRNQHPDRKVNLQHCLEELGASEAASTLTTLL